MASFPEDVHAETITRATIKNKLFFISILLYLDLYVLKPTCPLLEYHEIMAGYLMILSKGTLVLISGVIVFVFFNWRRPFG